MTENTPDAVRLASDFARRLRANADRAEADKFTVANLSTMSVDGCRVLAGWIDDAAAILGARAMQAAMPAPAGVRVRKLAEFARARIREAWAGCEEGDEIQEHAVRLGLIVEVPGGYDPDTHESQWDAEPGEPWFVFADWLTPSAIEDAGAREGAEDPMAELVAAQEPLGEEFERIWDANAERLQEDTPTPAGAGDLVERLRAYPNLRQTAGKLMQEAANALVALKAQIDAPKTEQDDPRYHSDHLDDNLGVPDDAGHCAAQRIRRDAAKISAAEAERDAWRERESETQEALQKIGEEFGIHGGEPRVDGLLRVLREQRAELAALRAEVERKDKALREAGEAIAEYFRYLNGGETRGSYDGKPEREGLRKAGYAVSRALSPAKGG